MHKPPPIPRKAIVLGVAIAVAIVLFSCKLLWELREDAWDNARRSSADVVSTVAHELGRSFQTYNLSLQHVVDELKTAGVMELPAELRDRVLFDRSTQAAYLGAILVLDARGNVFIDSRNPVPRRENFGDAEFFANHRDHDDELLHVGLPLRAPQGGGPRITLSRRLSFADGAFAGVVVGTMELAYFRDAFSKIDVGANGALSLTRGDGTMLMRFPYREEDIGRNVMGTEVFDRILAERNGAFIANASIDQVERQFVFRKVGDVSLYLTAAQSTDAIAASWQARAWMIAFLTAILLAGCGLLALILRRELVRRDEVEARLFAESERLRVTFESIGDAVLVTDVDGVVTYLNPVAERMSGLTSAEAAGRHSHDVLVITHNETGERVPHPIRIALAEERVVGLAADSVLHRHGGGTFSIEDSAAPIRDRDGAIVGAVMVFHDVSEARAMANRMSHLAQHDALTDLPNRVLLQDRLAQAIERGARNGTQAALLFLDLDRFKSVNDSLGHAAGDQLLVEMSQRLKRCVRESDTVSRLGGDEFVVLLSDMNDPQGPARVAEKILASLVEPFAIANHSVVVGASVGVAVYPRDGTTVDALAKNADAAMYLAKQSGRNTCRFFTSELGDLATHRLSLERAIADGLARDEFVMHYQPQYRADDGAFAGVEALMRWERDGALLPPAEFLAFAEECGQGIALGEAGLRMACAQAARWHRATRPFRIAVNVSAGHFRSHGFVERVRAILDETGLAARWLELELTESALSGPAERTMATLQRLRALGVGTAIDNFGTGYTSLSSLRGFRVDRVKIDRSLVRDIAAVGDDTTVVEAMIGLARNLGLDVVAEGVETRVQIDVLTTLGCAEMQGYLTGRPIPPELISFDDARDLAGDRMVDGALASA